MYEVETEDIIKAQNKSKEALDKLVQANTGLIWSIVKRFSGRGYAGEDLYQIGTIGFIKSIKRFDTSFDVKLSTYAVPYILGEIKRFIRDDGTIKVSRSTKELACKIRDIQNRYLSKNGKEITIMELAKKPLYTTKANLERSGMGFTIMESFMDELKVESNLGIGTKITMKKVIKN